MCKCVGLRHTTFTVIYDSQQCQHCLAHLTSSRGFPQQCRLGGRWLRFVQQCVRKLLDDAVCVTRTRRNCNTRQSCVVHHHQSRECPERSANDVHMCVKLATLRSLPDKCSTRSRPELGSLCVLDGQGPDVLANATHVRHVVMNMHAHARRAHKFLLLLLLLVDDVVFVSNTKMVHCNSSVRQSYASRFRSR